MLLLDALEPSLVLKHGYSFFMCPQTRSIPKIKEYFESVIPQFEDSTFQEHFRLSREAVEQLLLTIGSVLMSAEGPGRPSIEPQKKVLLFLTYIGGNGSLRHLATTFGISKSSCSRIQREVTNAIVSKVTVFIRFPRRAEDFFEMERKFRFPGAIGAIDGTHVRILPPSLKGGKRHMREAFYNRKQFHSLNIQAVCDSETQFIDVYAKYPGSVHDARIFVNSDLYKSVTSGDIVVPNRYHLLADAAYPCSDFVLPPFRDNGVLTAQQREFNKQHSRSRVVIERAFGMMKSRFRIFYGTVQVPRVQVPALFVAGCALHNLCVKFNDANWEQPFQPDPELNTYVSLPNDIFDGVDKRVRTMELLGIN